VENVKKGSRKILDAESGESTWGRMENGNDKKRKKKPSHASLAHSSNKI
jgi:hypothetical protein